MNVKPLPPKSVQIKIPSFQLQLFRGLPVGLSLLPLLRLGDVEQLVKPLLHHHCNLTDFRISAVENDGVVDHQVDIGLQTVRGIGLVGIQFLFDCAQIPRVFLRDDIEVSRDLQQHGVDWYSEDE